MTAATMNSSSTTPAALASAYSASTAERQHDELHPARDDDRRAGGAGGGRRRRGRDVGTSSAIPAVRVWRRARRPREHPVRRRRRRLARQAHAAGLLPALRERHEPTFVVVNGENAAGGLGITPKIADELFARRRRRHHARQPRLPPARDLRLPRPHERDPAALQLPAQPAGARRLRRRARRRAARRREPQRQPLPARRAPGVHRRSTRRSASCAGRVDHVLVDFHAEATSEKVALGWYLDGRVTRGRRHPHPRADRGRPRAAGRHGLHHRRRHDRPARRRHRRAQGAVDPRLRHAHERALRDLRRRPVADGRRRALLARPMRADAIEQVLLPAA